MRWLFIVGLAFDLSGAAVIAWPIVYAARGELREEGTMRYGRNAWVIAARTREQRFVRFGVALLALGFFLQLLAYLVSLKSDSEKALAVVVLIAIVSVSIVVAPKVASRGLPRYLAEPSASADAIEDMRVVYQLRDVREAPLFWRIASGRELTEADEPVSAYVNHGRWVADCQCGGGMVASPDLDRTACTDCATVYRVAFPENRAQIESILLARPEKRNRNWRPGATLRQLESENAENGLPLFVGGGVAHDLPHSKKSGIEPQ